jgi:putative hydrolase of the HAD superfamily
MKIRAVIFDIYKTLLEVGPPPTDAAKQWERLWTSTFGGEVRVDLKTFSVECEKIIAREHALGRANGIAYPEIYWPAVTAEVLPEMSRLSESGRDDFLYQHAQLQRNIQLMPGAAEALRRLMQMNLLLGIASNAQPYTLRELDAALAVTYLSRKIFSTDLTFFSFENGFSKPDPHVFQLLTARALALGVLPEEILMVGDRLDNDINPAQIARWQTWHFNSHAQNTANEWNRFTSEVCG